VVRPPHEILASVHKYLRFCDLCKELAFGAQFASAKSCFSYNSLEVSVLCRRFLKSTPLGLRHLLRERNFKFLRRHVHQWCERARGCTGKESAESGSACLAPR